MRIVDSLLPEFDQETASTRRTLERVPEDRFGWRPHAKSGTMIWLATHLATLPSWTVDTIGKDSIDISPGGAPPTPPPPAKSRQDLLDTFDTKVREARAALVGASDEQVLAPWSLLMNGKTIFTLPKIVVVRSWVMNHMIHHRAQLGVYLRLNDIAVPAIYGPSADEGSM
jgi:uncharacterized damage-inducible protein DinB